MVSLFSGTIDLHPDILTPADQTSLAGVSYVGQRTRTMFDRRLDGWAELQAHLFQMRYDDGLSAEVLVNPELGHSGAAEVQAQKYGEIMGRLPAVLRREVKTLWIHRGIEPFGSGNNQLLIHTGQAERYELDGILEEALVHEAAHTALDPAHASAPAWREAQRQDGNFISTYALEYPEAEDIAESFIPYLAIRYRPACLSPMLVSAIAQAIPHRIAYFDAQSFDMYPVGPWSLVGHEDTSIRFINDSPRPISTYWVDYEGREIFYDTLPPNAACIQPTYVTHPWRVRDTETGRLLRSVLPDNTDPLDIRISQGISPRR